MEKGGTFFHEKLSRKNKFLLRRLAQKLGEKSLQRFIPLRGQELKPYFLDFELREELLQTFVLNAADKGPAAHYPGVHLKSCPFQPARQDSDFPQGTVFVPVAPQ